MGAGTFLVLAAVASAGGGHGAEGPAVALGTLLATWIAFGILFAVLAKFAWKPMMEMVEAREKRLAGDLHRAEEVRKEAEKFRHEYHQRIQAAHEETDRILAEGRAKAEGVCERLLAEARKDAESTVEKARKAIEEERRRAVADLQARLGKISVALAGKILEKEIRPEHHADLIARFAKELGEAAKSKAH